MLKDGDYLMMLSVEMICVSDRGSTRIENQDLGYLNGQICDFKEQKFGCERRIQSSDQFIFAICDGMGGESDGKFAAQTTLENLEQMQKNDNSAIPINLLLADLNSFVEKTNDLIFEIGEEQKYKSIGTTFSSLVLSNDQFGTVHVGDSRIYLYKSNQLVQLTKDHNEYERFLLLNSSGNRACNIDHYKNQLTRFLGMNPEMGKLDADLGMATLVEKNDIFLLCSDGFYSVMDRTFLIEHLECWKVTGCIDPNVLIEHAMHKGSTDNITLILLRII